MSEEGQPRASVTTNDGEMMTGRENENENENVKRKEKETEKVKDEMNMIVSAENLQIIHLIHLVISFLSLVGGPPFGVYLFLFLFLFFFYFFFFLFYFVCLFVCLFVFVFVCVCVCLFIFTKNEFFL
jgi:uncharacterized membrane protein